MINLTTNTYAYDEKEELVSVSIERGIMRAFIKYEVFRIDSNYEILFNSKGYSIIKADSKKLVYEVVITDEEIKKE